MRWYREETEGCIKIAFGIAIFIWIFETNLSGSMDSIFDNFFYYGIWFFSAVLVAKILFKKYRNQNMFPKQLYQGALRGNSKGRWNREDLKRYGLDKKRKRRRRK